MQDLIEKKGEPDLHIDGFRAWIRGYSYPEADNLDDANWLWATVQCFAADADVRCTGTFLDLRSLRMWCDELQRFDRTGIATLECIEPNLNLYLRSVDRLGHVELTVELTPEHMTQQHRFIWEIDESYIPRIIESINSILRRWPTRKF